MRCVSSKTTNPVTPMKKLFALLFFATSLPLFAHAQILVNGKNINDIVELEYIELIVDRRAFNQGQVFAVIDYGQTIRAVVFRQHRIKDEAGADKLFGGEMDIFNFLSKNGWIHETTYSVGDHGFVYHIFRKKK